MASKKSCMGWVAGAGIVLFSVTAQGFMEDYELHPAVADFHEQFLEERLELGLRISHFTFKEGEQYSYDENGQINGGYTAGISTYDMEEEQSYMPYPYLRYNIIPYLGVQVGWEKIEGKTITMVEDRHSNGNVVLSGPSFMVYGRYPVQMFEPYAGVGVVLFNGNFDHDAAWHDGGWRNMEIDDTTGYLMTLGSSIAFHKNLKADISFSSLKAETDARYWMEIDSRYRAEWAFPCDSWIFQVGVKYAF